MHEIITHIHSLIDRLASAPHDENSIEAQMVALLAGLRSAIKVSDTLEVSWHQSRLHALWLQRVPWCSSLSRELEKVLTQLAELSSEPPGEPLGRQPF